MVKNLQKLWRWLHCLANEINYFTAHKSELQTSFMSKFLLKIFCFGLLSIFWKEKRTGYHGRMKVVQLSLRKGTKLNLYGNSVYLLSNKSQVDLSLTVWVQEFVIFSQPYCRDFSINSPILLPPQKPKFLNHNSAGAILEYEILSGCFTLINHFMYYLFTWAYLLFLSTEEDDKPKPTRWVVLFCSTLHFSFRSSLQVPYLFD